MQKLKKYLPATINVAIIGAAAVDVLDALGAVDLSPIASPKVLAYLAVARVMAHALQKVPTAA